MNVTCAITNETAETRVRWVLDDDYQTRGSYAYDTEEETKAAEDWELERLQSGEFVALGAIVERKCPACGQWEHVDSLWGIVIEPDVDKLAAYALECLEGVVR